MNKPTYREIGNCFCCKELVNNVCLNLDHIDEEGNCSAWKWNGQYYSCEVIFTDVTEDGQIKATIIQGTNSTPPKDEINFDSTLNFSESDISNYLMSGMKNFLDKCRKGIGNE